MRFPEFFLFPPPKAEKILVKDESGNRHVPINASLAGAFQNVAAEFAGHLPNSLGGFDR